MLGKKVLFLLGLAAFQVNSSELSIEHQKWVSELSNKYDITEEVITNAITQAKFDETVITKIQTPWERKPWYKYSPIFITESRINKGVTYWNKHEKTLEKAALKYGVPAQIIVAITGVETFYGKYKGNISVLDSLYTLGFNYPKRGKFFRNELAQFIKLSKQQNWNIKDVKGSYAGAMGLGQFISSSYLNYGVDFSRDGYIDMINDPSDAIGSIANYFNKHKWHNGEAVAYPVTVPVTAEVKGLLSKSLKISDTWSDLQDAGIKMNNSNNDLSIKANTPAKLLKLQQENSAEYWVYFDNFYTITRYNHSPLYAMAVYQLSEKILQAKNAK